MTLESPFFTVPYLWMSAIALILFEIAIIWVKEKHDFLKLILLLLFALWTTMALINGVSLILVVFYGMVLLLPLLIQFIRRKEE